jgi:hypothetical protein
MSFITERTTFPRKIYEYTTIYTSIIQNTWQAVAPAGQTYHKSGLKYLVGFLICHTSLEEAIAEIDMEINLDNKIYANTTILELTDFTSASILLQRTTNADGVIRNNISLDAGPSPTLKAPTNFLNIPFHEISYKFKMASIPGTNAKMAVVMVYDAEV